MADERSAQVSLISGNSGTVNIINSTITIVSETPVNGCVSKPDGQVIEPTLQAFGIIESEEDVTWLERGKLVMFHNRPIRAGSDRYYGKQILPGSTRNIAINLSRYDKELMNDVQFLMELTHPNIIQLIDAGEHQSIGRWMYIVMEHCEKNLKEYVDEFEENPVGFKDSPVVFESFTAIFKQLIEVLDFLKQNNVLHRDINPDNIFITHEGIVKLADNNITRRILHSDVTLTSSGVGSDGYRSPEIYEEGSKISFASDIFSLGLVACFLFSRGKHPFGSDPFSWSYNIRNDKKMDLSIMKGVGDLKSRQLIQLVKSMLRHNPRDRPTANQIKAHGFFKKPISLSEKARTPSSLSKILRLRKSDIDSSPPSPRVIPFAELKVGELICGGFYSNFHKGSWKGMRVCVEMGSDNNSEVYMARKVRALTELRHRNIIRLVANTVEPTCLALELVSDEHLRSYLIQKKNTLSSANHFEISLQIADGMNHLLEKKYVHGNLCAEGILVGKHDVMKISRFRCAHQLDDVMDVNVEFLRTRWTAPEVFTSKKLTGKSDIWSYGVVLYEIFSNGSFPYRGTPSEKIANFLSTGQRLEKTEGCPHQVYQKMLDCWLSDPEKRPEFSQIQVFLRRSLETGL